MISFREFSKIFRDTEFTAPELKRFYYSVKKTVILKFTGRKSWPEIFALEERCQWPVVRMLDDPGLPIYKDADKVLMERFISTIHEEKKIRGRKSSLDKAPYWTMLKSVIDERIELFIDIFGFSDRDIRYCKMAAERYSRIIENRISKRKMMWQIGLGTGAATLAGAAAAWYFYKKDKK